MRSLLTNQLKRLLHRLGYDLVRWQPRRQWPEELSRFAYQRLIHDFDIEPGARVLDIGSGAYPFPLATILTDRYFETTEHRSEKLIIDQRPFLISNCSQLPFATQSFDFVYCSHLLEHVENPIEICAELVRVGRRGYIETPTLAKDMLFSWAKGMHRWHVMAIGQRLIFFEYSPRQLEGVRSEEWTRAIFASYHHPMQDVYYNNPDIFNIIFPWSDSFICECFYLDGRSEQRKFGISEEGSQEDV